MPIYCYTDDHRYAVEGDLDAAVVPCRHVQLGTAHRLKLAASASKAARAALVQEGKVQAQFRHPHIEAVTDVVDVEGRSGLILEGGEMCSLADVLGDPSRDIAALAGGLLAGVAYLHEQGWVHRNLRPQSLLVFQGTVAKLANFSSAKPIGADGRARLTRGTPGYLAPERLAFEAVDPREDVFSVGVLLYELVCGRRPFDGKDPVQVRRKQAGELTDPRHWVSDLRIAWQRAMVGALQVDPMRRWRDGGEFWRVWLGC